MRCVVIHGSSGERPFKEGDADYRYWRDSGLSKFVYHPDIKIGVIKKAIGNATYNLIGGKVES